MGEEPAPGLPRPQSSSLSPDSAQRREEMLHLLRESLAEWESRVNWDTLPESRRAALNTLAEESASTLRHLISNFEARSAGMSQPAQENVDGGS